MAIETQVHVYGGSLERGEGTDQDLDYRYTNVHVCAQLVTQSSGHLIALPRKATLSNSIVYKNRVFLLAKWRQMVFN